MDELPDQPGLKATQMIPAAHDGTLKALYVIGENPLVSDPDVNHAEKSLNNLDFLVVQDIFLTETAQLADVILPTACYAEKDGTFANTERRVQRVRKAVDPPGQAWDDWKICCEIATRMGYSMAYESSQQIMEEISKVTPSYAGHQFRAYRTRRAFTGPVRQPNTPGLRFCMANSLRAAKDFFTQLITLSRLKWSMMSIRCI